METHSPPSSRVQLSGGHFSSKISRSVPSPGIGMMGNVSIQPCNYVSVWLLSHLLSNHSNLQESAPSLQTWTHNIRELQLNPIAMVTRKEILNYLARIERNLWQKIPLPGGMSGRDMLYHVINTYVLYIPLSHSHSLSPLLSLPLSVSMYFSLSLYFSLPLSFSHSLCLSF